MSASASIVGSQAGPDPVPRLLELRRRLAAAVAGAGRPQDSVALVAVGKTFSAPVLARTALAGQERFGENYVQEALPKIGELRALVGSRPLEWHFLGPIQANKTRAIAEHFDWVHSVDRLRVAERLSAQRPAGLPRLETLIEVRLDEEPGKGGVAPEEALLLGAAMAGLPGLRLRGLMAIPRPRSDPGGQRESFARMPPLLARLREAVRAQAGEACAQAVDTLSMGMSADFEAAIHEGATIVRIGSAIFGERR